MSNSLLYAGLMVSMFLVFAAMVLLICANHQTNDCEEMSDE